MARKFTEQATVQDPLVKYADEVAWTPVSKDDQLTYRKGEAGLFFYDLLREQLIALNGGIVTEENVDEMIQRLEAVRNSIEGNEETLRWLRGQQSIYVDSEKAERNVTVIDFDHPGDNDFQVTGEWQYTNGQYTNRADVVFLINGIPVAVVETKSAKKPDGIDIAFAQIRRYHSETPEMMTAPQVFDLTHLISFFYGATWNLDRRNLFNWKDEEGGDYERKVKRFFDQERFLRVLRDYIAFIRKDDELSKLILRQHQTRAVEKVLERARDEERRRGLIWHTQGSGKTLTMITVAHQLLTRTEFGKPTVLMLVDRNELESQLFGNLHAHSMTEVQVTRNKNHLRELLGAGYRGLIVSMIHKFDGIPKDLNESEDVIVLVDEAHRSTGGDFGNYLMAALPNATYIGFTGTPIDRTSYGKGTFKVFGAEDEQGYLDKYSIAESIEDGTTLPLHYSLAPNEMRVPREQLEKEFLDLAEAEGVSDIEDLNRILDRAVTLKAFLKSPERVERVARFVATHYRENVEPLGYKAFLVGVDREACALYKEALDDHLPAEYSRVVYTSSHNDTEQLKAQYLSEDKEKELRRSFLRPGTLPKILIVTEKLLTGFDAPILYCMYLDKPMRDHALLQAIARVNRPYETEGEIKKPSGFVLDFVGVFENLEKALAFDSDDVSGVIQNLDVLKERFEQLMNDNVGDYLALAAPPIDDKSVERIVNAFVDKERRETFTKLFREVETLYEIISPDPFLRDYVESYQLFAAVYQIVRAAFRVKETPVRDLMKKTEEIVRQNVDTSGLDEMLPIYEINERTLDVLRKDGKPSDGTVVNLARSVARAVRDKEDEQPYLIPIGERAAHVLELFEDRQLTTLEALKELEKAIEEFNQAQREREQRGFDIATFSHYWILRRGDVDEDTAMSVAGDIEDEFGRFTHFRQNAEAMRDLKAELYKLLLPLVDKTRLTGLVDEMLKARRE